MTIRGIPKISISWYFNIHYLKYIQNNYRVFIKERRNFIIPKRNSFGGKPQIGDLQENTLGFHLGKNLGGRILVNNECFPHLCHINVPVTEGNSCFFTFCFDFWYFYKFPTSRIIDFNICKSWCKQVIMTITDKQRNWQIDRRTKI